MKGFIERAIKAVDIEKITADVMSSLIIKNLDMYFVVQKFPDSEEYDFVGMTYNRDSARTLSLQNGKIWPCKILHLDFGKLATLMEKLEVVDEIT